MTILMLLSIALFLAGLILGFLIGGVVEQGIPVDTSWWLFTITSFQLINVILLSIIIGKWIGIF